jgi:hypothetical protein
VNVKSTFELHAKSLAKAAKCISHCFSLIVATRLFHPKWINQQSSYRAIYRCGIAILQSPYSFIEELRKKFPRLGMGSLAYRFSEKGELG